MKHGHDGTGNPSAAPPLRRYRHFIDHFRRHGRAWILIGNSGTAMARDEQGREVVPVWPDAGSAHACACSSWPDYRPEEIDRQHMLAKLFPGLRRRGVCLAVYPTPDDKGVIVLPDQLEQDLH